jgi:hypothetical protein
MNLPLDFVIDFLYVLPIPMKKELKQQHPLLCVTPIDILAEIDPSKSNKYLPFLIRQINTKLKGRNEELKKGNYDAPFGLKKTDNFMSMLMYHMFANGDLLLRDEIQTLHMFNELMENKRIVEPDVNKYKDFEELRMAVNEAMIKYEYKDREKGIAIVLENEEYLFLRPLTYEASMKYGSNTKWCTAATSSRRQFDEYTQNGILIYIMDKKTTQKTAIHMFVNSDGTVRTTTFWNAADNQIDSLETNIDLVVLSEVLKDVKKMPRTNLDIAKELGVSDAEIEYAVKSEGQAMEDHYAVPHPIPNDILEEVRVTDEGGEDISQLNEALRDGYQNYQRNQAFIGIRNPCAEIPMEGNDMCNMEAPQEPVKINLKQKALNFISKLSKPFKKRKNIFILSYNTRITPEHAYNMRDRFKKSQVARDYELVIFDGFNNIDLERVVNGESVPDRG